MNDGSILIIDNGDTLDIQMICKKGLEMSLIVNAILALYLKLDIEDRKFITTILVKQIFKN